MKFNINENVMVRLNSDGLKILQDRHDELNKVCGGRLGPYAPEKQDKDGYTTFQLWTLMQAFGPYITMTRPSPFEANELNIPTPKPVAEAFGLLSSIRLTAHLHSFSEDQTKLLDEVIEKLRDVL